MLKRLQQQGVTRAVFSSSAGREVATAADNKISSDETELQLALYMFILKEFTWTRSRRRLGAIYEDS